jgi:hypothetical protein
MITIMIRMRRSMSMSWWQVKGRIWMTPSIGTIQRPNPKLHNNNNPKSRVLTPLWWVRVGEKVPEEVVERFPQPFLVRHNHRHKASNSSSSWGIRSQGRIIWYQIRKRAHQIDPTLC